MHESWQHSLLLLDRFLFMSVSDKDILEDLWREMESVGVEVS